MPGQPAGEFDVTQLVAIETEAGGVELPSSIIDVGESFHLRATFTGSGTNWNNMKALGLTADVQFYAEGMGPGVFNQNFGTTPVILDPAQDQYEVNSPSASVANAGIYRCGVVVTFRLDNPAPAPDLPWNGWLGFNEDCVIQIHPQEQ
jgi:hypothetical protein